MKTVNELEEVLPFTAIDGNGRAVSDLKKSEIIFLVNGINFRGFTLIAPGDPSLNAKTIPEPLNAEAPANAYYEIIFPYVWDAGQAIRIQLGTNRSGVYLHTLKNIKKQKSYLRIDELKAEILALELLKENSWLNLNLTSLNLYSGIMKTDARKNKSGKFYEIHLPAEYMKDRIDLFKITFLTDNPEIFIKQQFVTPASTTLYIEKENETYLLLVNHQKAAALVMKNILPIDSTSKPMATTVKITNEENYKINKSIADRRKLLTILQDEIKLIPVEILPIAVQKEAKTNMESIPEKPESVITAPQSDANAGTIANQAYSQLHDSKTSILNKLASYRLELTKTARMIYCEKALNYLKQNRIAKAIQFLVQALDLVPKKGDFVSDLVKKLNLLEQSMKKILAESALLKEMNLEKEFHKIGSKLSLNPEKDEIARFFTDLQAIVDKNQKGFGFVQETLSKIRDLPEIMEEEPEVKAKVETRGTIAPTALELKQQIDALLLTQNELANKTFISELWLAEVTDNLKRILAQYVLQVSTNEQYLPLLPEKMAEAAIRFVMINNHAFSKPFRRSFYEKKLRSLGIAAELLKESSFFDVVIQALAIEKNSKGFWEVAFADDISMIYIPHGSFTMGVPWEAGGAEDESPQHEVHLDAYWLAKYETTFQQFDRFCDDTARGIPSDLGKGREKRPVIGISYQDAQNYIQWLSHKTEVSFRLPTEAQWEKAARGSDKRKYPWGNTDPNGSRCNYADVNFLKYYLRESPPQDNKEKQQIINGMATASDDGQIFTAPVGSYPQGASPFGAMDMAGNVWEWVADWYDGNYYQKSPRQNPPGSFSGTYRIVRGGSWDCNYWLLRCTGRTGAPPIPNQGSESLGFRVAASPLPTTQTTDTANPGELK